MQIEWNCRHKEWIRQIFYRKAFCFNIWLGTWAVIARFRFISKHRKCKECFCFSKVFIWFSKNRFLIVLFSCESCEFDCRRTNGIVRVYWQNNCYVISVERTRYFSTKHFRSHNYNKACITMTISLEWRMKKTNIVNDRQKMYSYFYLLIQIERLYTNLNKIKPKLNNNQWQAQQNNWKQNIVYV